MSGGQKQQASEDVTLLKKCAIDDLRMLLHKVVDKLCGRRPPLFINYQQVWSIKEWWDVLAATTRLLQTVVKNDWTKDEIFSHLSNLPDDYQEAIYDCISSRKEEIIQQLSDATSQLHDDAFLTDFDWQLNFVVGSDKMANINQPLASVMLYVREGEEQKEVLLEMDKGQLSKFITTLENAQKALSQIQI